LPAVRPPVLSRRRAGYPSSRLPRHGVLGRTAARAASDGPDCPGENRRHHSRGGPGVLRPGTPGPALDAVVRGAAVSGSHGQDIRAGGTVTATARPPGNAAYNRVGLAGGAQPAPGQVGSLNLPN